MTKFPSLKPREVERILLRNKFLVKRQTGSHRIFYSAALDATVVVPIHSTDIPKGTMRSIIKQSRLPEEVFLKKK